MDWNDLKPFLSVSRAGSLSGASAVLGVSTSTVSRRIEALEAAIGTRLFKPHREGYHLTDAGRTLLPFAEKAETDIAALLRASKAPEDRLRPVLIEAPELLGQAVLLPALAVLLADHPALRIELNNSVRSISLRDEGPDIIFRLMRPTQGRYRTRRVAQIGFGLYASCDYVQRHGLPTDPQDLVGKRLIGWTDAFAHLIMAQWLNELAPHTAPSLRLTSLGSQMAAALEGLGWAVLPDFAARSTPLVRGLGKDYSLYGDLWMLVSEDAEDAPLVQVVKNRLVNSLRVALAPSLPSCNVPELR